MPRKGRLLAGDLLGNGSRAVSSPVGVNSLVPWAGYVSPEVFHIAQAFFEGLDSARSLTALIMLREGEWSQLINLSCKPDQYLDADDYYRATCATDFLRKYVPVNLDCSALDKATFNKWLWGEHQCLRTNLRLAPYLGPHSWGTVEGHVARVIEQARKNVLTWIGHGPNDPVEGRFGPGATVSDSARRTTVPEKMSSVPTLTPDAWRFLVPWSGTKWRAAFGDADLSVVRGNSYFTVPKDGKIRRACGKEPSVNVFYQLALGGQLRRRLFKVGLDLDSGQAVHREVARLASIRDDRATIDLSSASDCVATSLVSLLLPPLWEKYLSACRSPTTTVEGKCYVLEKYSSMGNGFTFELETLLFAALVSSTLFMIGFRSCPGRDFWVYGDDIIVDSGASKAVLAVLKFFGFTPNLEKTFSSGNFRESCGGDFFRGVPVRAHFLEEDPDEPQKVISLANGVRRAAKAADGFPDPRFTRAWFKCLDLLPSTIRVCRGPENLGDIVIHDDISKWSTRWRSSIRYLKVYRPATYRKVKWSWFDPEVQFAAALYGVRLTRPDTIIEASGFRRTMSESAAFIVPRDGVSGYKVGWAPYS